MGADDSTRALVAHIAQATMAVCPPGWQRAQVRWRQVGVRQEHDGTAVGADGVAHPLTVPEDVLRQFSELRRQQYSVQREPWFSARIRLDYPDRFALDTSAEEPVFLGRPPEPADYLHDGVAQPWPDAVRPPWLSEILESVEVVTQVSAALQALGAPDSAVTFSSSSSTDWLVVRSPGRWHARQTANTVAAQSFPTVRAATAYALGHVALSRVAAPVDEVFRAGQRIDALPAEPPLSLFRGLRLQVLRPGTLLDRLGAPTGNVTYFAGTPHPMRSLPPDLTSQPSTVYRVCRAVEALAGEAVAWFGQPGGGTAVVLPRSLDELVHLGVLERTT